MPRSFLVKKHFSSSKKPNYSELESQAGAWRGQWRPDGPHTWGVAWGGAGAPGRDPLMSPHGSGWVTHFLQGWVLFFYFVSLGWDGVRDPPNPGMWSLPLVPRGGRRHRESPVGWARVWGDRCGWRRGSPLPHPSQQGGQGRRAPVGWVLPCPRVGWGSESPWGGVGCGPFASLGWCVGLPQD